ncbi:phosphohydrolase [Paraburkholderia caffeinilytica]
MAVCVAGIAIPDSAMACAATSIVRESGPDILFRHACRAFFFASLIGHRRSMSFDPELLYVASMFLHYGLGPLCRESKRRFEVDSADAAGKFLRSHGVSETAIHDVWSAIALHTTFGISDHPSPLVGLLNAGIETDLMAMHFDEVEESKRTAIVIAYPRGHAFKSLVIEAFAEGMTSRPETTFGTVNADILDRCDPDYRRVNYCGRILGSAWTE